MKHEEKDMLIIESIANQIKLYGRRGFIFLWFIKNGLKSHFNFLRQAAGLNGKEKRWKCEMAELCEGYVIRAEDTKLFFQSYY